MDSTIYLWIFPLHGIPYGSGLKTVLPLITSQELIKLYDQLVPHDLTSCKAYI